MYHDSQGREIEDLEGDNMHQDWLESLQEPRVLTLPPDFPTIVCLCGSTRFMDAFQEANLNETLAGNIVLSIGCNTKDDSMLNLPEATKITLDELHKRKIDLADEVLILNVGGYIGESTRAEIEYAREHPEIKTIRYLVEDTRKIWQVQERSKDYLKSVVSGQTRNIPAFTRQEAKDIYTRLYKKFPSTNVTANVISDDIREWVGTLEAFTPATTTEPPA